MVIVAFFHFTAAVVAQTKIGLRVVVRRGAPVALNLLMVPATIATATTGHGTAHLFLLFGARLVLESIFVLVLKLISVRAHLSVDAAFIANTRLPALALTESCSLSWSGCSISLSGRSRSELIDDLLKFKILPYHLEPD